MVTRGSGRFAGLSARRIAATGASIVAVVLMVGVAGSSAASSSAVCSQAKPFIAGTPSQSLLSILGVLRRPGTSSDAPPEYIKNFVTASFKRSGIEVFADYIRRAGVIGGTTYYVMPVRQTGCGFLR